MSNDLSFKAVVNARHSVRDFLPTPVPQDVLRSVLADAQQSPSNCNTQPWEVHIVSGAKRDALSTALLAASESGGYSMDYTFDQSAFYDDYSERSSAQGALYHKALGVKREDFDERKTIGARNLTFFGAPHVVLLFVPPFGDSARVASDVGMYGQTFLLSLVAHGLGGVPQTMLGMFADTVRDALQIETKAKLLFGISFGYPDGGSISNSFRMDRASIEECVTFHE
jgi:nitroreductase